MKTPLTILFFIFSIAAIAQKDYFPIDDSKKHEIKLNALGILTSEWLDVSYEYLINEESSLGINLQFDLDGDSDIYDYTRNWSVTTYYRRYFSKKFAQGFYVEGFFMLHNREESFHFFNGFGPSVETRDRTNGALGVSLGYKIVSKNGFIVDLNLGAGRNLGNNGNFSEVTPRLGISLGYRF